jgi:hypothetical protein
LEAVPDYSGLGCGGRKAAVTFLRQPIIGLRGDA